MEDLFEQPNEVIEEAVNELDLLPEQKSVVMEIFDWVKRMTESFGPTVNSTTGEEYDWGQALCREQFGPNWQHHMVSHNISMPTRDDLNRAIEWEKGNVPDWVSTKSTD
jgi:hypothetical protein